MKQKKQKTYSGFRQTDGISTQFSREEQESAAVEETFSELLTFFTVQ